MSDHSTPLGGMCSARLDPNGPAFKTNTGPDLSLNIERSWTERWRRADLGVGNGHGNARSVARIQSTVACGGEVDGVRLLSPKTIDRIFEVVMNTMNHIAERTDAVDRVTRFRS
jgi:hypothetical protein